MQHGAVGLVANSAQCFTLSGAGRIKQRERLVGVRRQHHLVEVFNASIGADTNAGRITLDGTHRCVQPLVTDACNDFFDIVARAALHCPPLRTISDLDQPVVVAKTDHRGDRELQHLVGRAGPDATHHRQEVPVTKRCRKPLGAQKIAQRLQHGGLRTGTGQRGGDAVEANDVCQHAQEFRIDDIAALGKNTVQAGAAPFQALAVPGVRHLDRKRHVGPGSFHAQFGKKIDQLRVGTFVEHQKAGVNAVLNRGGAVLAGQGHVNGVRVAAEIGTGLKQRDVCFAVKGVRYSEA